MGTARLRYYETLGAVRERERHMRRFLRAVGRVFCAIGRAARAIGRFLKRPMRIVGAIMFAIAVTGSVVYMVRELRGNVYFVRGKRLLPETTFITHAKKCDRTPLAEANDYTEEQMSRREIERYPVRYQLWLRDEHSNNEVQIDVSMEDYHRAIPGKYWRP